MIQAKFDDDSGRMALEAHRASERDPLSSRVVQVSSTRGALVQIGMLTVFRLVETLGEAAEAFLHDELVRRLCKSLGRRTANQPESSSNLA